VRRHRARRLLTVYLLVLAALTLIPTLGPTVTDLVVHVAEALGATHSPRTAQFVDAATNAVLFVPAGLLLGAAVPRLPPVAVWLLCLAASGAIEVAQAFAVPGRTASLVDVAANGVGAALGVLLAAVLRRRLSLR
jgi:VanZ family protein